ncbi:hypothetical protein GQ457_06G009840 [Hibiscus cannabinus]
MDKSWMDLPRDQLRAKRVEYEAAASSDGSVNEDELENQVMADVFGPERYGRVRGKGAFVTPTKYFGSSSSQFMPSQSQSSKAEVSRIKQQLTEEMNQKLDEKVAQLQAQAEAMEATTKENINEGLQKLQVKFLGTLGCVYIEGKIIWRIIGQEVLELKEYQERGLASRRNKKIGFLNHKLAWKLLLVSLIDMVSDSVELRKSSKFKIKWYTFI